MSDNLSTDFAGRNFMLKTNYVAAQADGSMLVYYGDTVVLVTAVSLKSVREGVDFLPLTVSLRQRCCLQGKELARSGAMPPLSRCVRTTPCRRAARCRVPSCPALRADPVKG